MSKKNKTEEKKTKKGGALKKIGIIVGCLILIYVVVLFASLSAAKKNNVAKAEDCDIGDDKLIESFFSKYDKSINDEMYIKQVTSKDISNELDMFMVTNCVVVFLEDGKGYDFAEEVAAKYDASIVGYIKAVDCYELELSGDSLTYTELSEKANAIEKEDGVLFAIADEYGAPFIKNQTPGEFSFESEDAFTISEETKNSYKTLGLDALEKYSEIADNTKIAIYDYPVVSTPKPLEVSEGNDYWSEIFAEKRYDSEIHGTAVAGVAAGKKTDSGFTGVCPGADIYSYSFNFSSKAMVVANYVDMFEIENIRVCNQSFGQGPALAYAIMKNNQNAVDYYNKNVEFYTVLFNKILDDGYDFVITQAAGNSGAGSSIIKTSDSYFGYSDFENSTSGLGLNLPSFDFLKLFVHSYNGKNCEYESFIAGIKDERVKEHIICVVSSENNSVNSEGIFSGSSRGEAAEMAAPVGSGVALVVPGGFTKIPGTSFAAPMVAGAAALMYSVNEDLTAADIKDIMCSTSKVSALDADFSYPVLNAAAAVEAAAKK